MRWREMSRSAQAAVMVAAGAELALTAAAVIDLVRRDRGPTRGPAALWWPALIIQPVGPIVYLAFGSRRGGAGGARRSRSR